MVTNRKYHIDLIKIFAIFMVIFNHTGDSGFLAYQKEGPVLVQMLQMIPSIVCKTAVPLFYMCTGALLLGKDESIKKLWKNRVLKYVLILVGFTLFYYVFLSLRNHTPMDFGWILKTIYGTTTFSYSGAYWFLYSYVGFLIMLPFLRNIAQSLNREQIVYLILINTFVRGVFPVVEIVLHMETFAVDMVLMTADVFFYPFIGYYIEKCTYEEVCNKKNLLGLFGMAVLSVLVSGFFTFYYLYSDAPTQACLTMFGLYLVMFIYVMCKWICYQINFNEKSARCITTLSGCSFGVYLVHGFIYTLLDDYIFKLGITMNYGVAWFRTYFVFVIGSVVVWMCKRICDLKR